MRPGLAETKTAAFFLAAARAFDLTRLTLTVGAAGATELGAARGALVVASE